MEEKKNTYTEKITLRLTPEDREQYQKEAEAKKVPLTTLLRNKISGVDMEVEVFEPQLIHYDRSGHNRKNYEAKKHLGKFESIKSIVDGYVDLPTTDEGWTELVVNPLNYVKKYIELKHRPQINLPISSEKLMDLLGIDLSPIDRGMNGYDSRFLMVVDGVVMIRDYRGEFEYYTRNEEENERLKLCRTLIESFTNIIDKYRLSGGIHELSRTLSNRLRVENGELIPDHNFVRG
tara:strand:- start:2175 stop:2876 length:702 start_codon:yes stop_codon:yes gene_type:complete